MARLSDRKENVSIIDASATERGFMGISAQTFAGDKTFNDDVSIGTTQEAAGDKLTVGFGGTNSFLNSPGMTDRIVVKGGTASSDLGVIFAARDGQAARLYLGEGGDTQRATISGTATGTMELATNGGTVALTIGASQDVGIGITPSEKLHVNGKVRSSGFYSEQETINTNTNATLDFTNLQLDFHSTYLVSVHAPFNGTDGGSAHWIINVMGSTTVAGSGNAVYSSHGSGLTFANATYGTSGGQIVPRIGFTSGKGNIDVICTVTKIGSN